MIKLLDFYDKWISERRLLEHLGFAILFLLAWVFSDERLAADSGYYLIQVINHKSFWVEHQRYILALSQVFPLIAVKLSLPLSAVLKISSLGHVVFFYMTYLLCTYKLGNKRAGVLLIFVQTLGITSGFFVPMFELYYAAAIIVIFMSMLRIDNKGARFILMILAALIFTSHPFAVIILVFAMGLDHFSGVSIPKIKLIDCTIIFIGYVALKLFFSSDYEQNKTEAFVDNLEHSTYGIAYVGSLLMHLAFNYWTVVILLLIALASMYTNRRYKVMMYSMTYLTAIMVVINLSFYGFDTSRYAEQVYFPFFFSVAYAFVYFIPQKFALQIASGFLVAFVFIVQTSLIVHKGATQFQGRLSELNGLIQMAQTLPGQKFFVEEATLEYDPNWSYPIESMLLSAKKGVAYSVSICTDVDLDYENNRLDLESNKYLFRRFELYHVDALNPLYFSLPDASYQSLHLSAE